jgi:hypothetical protein
MPQFPALETSIPLFFAVPCHFLFPPRVVFLPKPDYWLLTPNSTNKLFAANPIQRFALNFRFFASILAKEVQKSISIGSISLLKRSLLGKCDVLALECVRGD